MTNRTSNMPGTEDILGHSERQTRRLIQRANDPAGEPIWEHIRRPWSVRLTNAVGAGLRRFGVRWPRLDAGTLLAAARRRSGRSDFGDGRFREGLGVLVDAFNARDDAHAFGRILFSSWVGSLLVSRLPRWSRAFSLVDHRGRESSMTETHTGSNLAGSEPQPVVARTRVKNS